MKQFNNLASRIFLSSLILSLLLIYPASYASPSDWEEIGSLPLSSGVVQDIAGTVINDGEPLVGFSDVGDSGKISAFVFSSGSWVTVGAPGFSNGGADNLSVDADTNGTPYIAYRDFSIGNKIVVKDFSDGTAWQDVGTAGFSSGSVQDISLKIHPGGNPFVAYIDSNLSNQAIIKEYDSGNWHDVGNPISNAGVQSISLDFDSGGNPLVAYSDNSLGNAIVVKQLSSGNWDDVGLAGFSVGAAQHISLDIDNSGEIFVAYRDDGLGGKVVVKHFSAGNWDNVGIPGFSSGSVDSISFESSDAGNLVIAYSDAGFSGKTVVQEFSSGSWNTVGTPGFSSGSALYTQLIIGDILYTAYADSSLGSGLFVQGLAEGPNSNPRDIILNGTSIQENSPVGTLVGTLSTIDTDLGDTHTYTLVSGTGEINNGNFTLSGSTLSTAGIFNYEVQSSFSIRLRTTDSGSGNLTYEKQILGTIIDLAESGVGRGGSAVTKNDTASEEKNQGNNDAGEVVSESVLSTENHEKLKKVSTLVNDIIQKLGIGSNEETIGLKNRLLHNVELYLKDGGNVELKQNIMSSFGTFRNHIKGKKKWSGKLLSAGDCDEIKVKWEIEKIKLGKHNCDAEKKAMDDAKKAYDDAKKAHTDAKDARKKADTERDKAEKEMKDFFKNGLGGNDNISLNPKDGLNNSVGISGSDITIYFSGNGSDITDLIKGFSAQYSDLREAFYDALKASKEAAENEKKADEKQKTAGDDYKKALKAYEECLKKGKDIETKIKNYEETYDNCVKTIKAQEVTKKKLDLTDEAINGASSAIEKIQDDSSVGSSSKVPCPDADEAKAKKDAARKEAKDLLKEAKDLSDKAKTAYENGNLKAAELLDAQAKAKADEAKEKADEAKKHQDEEKKSQDICDKKVAEEKKAADKIREVKVYDEAQNIDKKTLQIGIHADMKLELLNIKASSKNTTLCERMLIKIVQDAAGSVFADLTFKLGIDLIKAPIDALTPEGFAAKVGQKLTGHILGAIGADNLTDYAIEAVAGEIGGVLFPKLLADDALGSKVNDLSKKSIGKLLEEEGVQSSTFTVKEKVWIDGKWRECDATVNVMYNPHTRYVVIIVKGECCPGVMVMKYQVNERGFREGPMTRKYYQ